MRGLRAQQDRQAGTWKRDEPPECQHATNLRGYGLAPPQISNWKLAQRPVAILPSEPNRSVN